MHVFGVRFAKPLVNSFRHMNVWLDKSQQSSFKKGPHARRPRQERITAIADQAIFFNVLTKPPALSTRSASATPSHSFLSVKVKEGSGQFRLPQGGTRMQ